MLPILPLVLGSAGLAAGATLVNKWKKTPAGRSPLFEQLKHGPAASMATAVSPLVTRVQHDMAAIANELSATVTTLVNPEERATNGQALVAQLSTHLTTLDQHYQQWIHDHVDPIFGGKRYQQMRALSGGRAEELSAVQKQANYLLAWAGAGLGLAAATTLLGIPVGVVSIPFGLVVMAPTVRVAYRKAVYERKFSIVHLGLLYLIGLYMGGYLFIGASGLFLLAFGYKIGALTEAVIRDGLVNIFGQQPRYAWRVVDGIETEVPIEQVAVGDILVFDVGQMIPIDGVIVKGVAAIDQHMLTGEAQPAEKTVGDPVLAATIVLSGRIYVQVEKAGPETTAAQIGEVLNRIATYRPSLQEKAIARADHSLIPMLAGSGLGFLLAGPVGGLAMMGCNFTLNMVGLIPLTLLNFLNASSHVGILVKEGEALEKLHTVDTVVFDKTGTLTIEQPHVVHVHACDLYPAATVLRLAAAAEHRQSHPVAKAILAAAAEWQLALPKVEDAHYEVGYGIKVRVTAADIHGGAATPAAAADFTDTQLIRVGSWRFMALEAITIPVTIQALLTTAQEQGHSLVFVALDDRLIGAVELHATVRPEARAVVTALQQRGMKTYIISGDQEAPTRTLAHALGMDGYFANTLPEHKAELVTQLKAEGRKVCFVGDGINDAIALKQADVSVSLCGATTAATDTAQVVLMDADLQQLVTLIELVDEMHRNLRLNHNTAMAFTLLGAGGILFFHAGFAIVELLYAASIATGVGIASMPMLKTQAHSDDPSLTVDAKP